MTNEQYEALIAKLEDMSDTIIRVLEGISNLESRLDDLEVQISDGI